MIYEEIFGEYWLIKIGRNADENDQLLRSSPKESLWFHLKGMPSPHGILFNKDNKYNEESIHKCASLVKKFSKGKNIPKLAVEYLPLKNVKLTDTKGLVEISKKTRVILI